MSTNQVTTSTPIAAIRTSAHGEVRMSLDTIDGERRLNVRKWYQRRDGGWAPTVKGLTVALEHLEELATALDLARKEAGR